ncbi:2-oxoisovalerate dehydrogenase subunit beta [Sporomusa silvacetica DSM 10669]|uniref:2-oxoisovalerate dehydrogenase subunit beta n=1 Tax=Sporomusa silvacetica DSM 10669 TaxID=1123289 RepID=A0ABZ3IKN2_9FIRM|nr:alpha-ketoacid dehydrogenase subunit beta [Sporomusa silvacetica]OZC13457.1 2-oxoisovalerate dehydrogenase subunit beta [Sporomusa silvacetica DSM 10669]
MSKKSISQAINAALTEEMTRDGNIYLMGEDIGLCAGCFGVTKGIIEKYGEDRVIETPIAETGFCAMAVGSAVTGKRPVVELMFADFVSLAFNPIVMEAAKLRYVSGGKATVPIVFRAAQGAGGHFGLHHSNCVEGWLMNSPGLIVVSPSTAADAKGLLKAAIRSDNPVVFLEHKMMYGVKGEVPEGDYIIPLGKADVVKEGKDVTVIASQLMRTYTEAAIKEVEKEGISVELIDPRTILPFDIETFAASAKKTGRVIIVHEHPKTGGVGGEFAAAITEQCFAELKKPVKRVCGADISVGMGDVEPHIFPTAGSIADAIRDIVK